jgi:hypothetical protein
MYNIVISQKLKTTSINLKNSSKWNLKFENFNF